MTYFEGFVVPVPTAVPSHAYDPATSSRNDFKSIEIAAPQGANFTMDGSTVHWDKWQFHLRVDKRVGPILSRIAYQDGKDLRSVAYQMNASEMFVPYMDPAQTWAFKAYMDIGEYGFGALSSPLEAGSDCPANAKFLDAVLALPLPPARSGPVKALAEQLTDREYAVLGLLSTRRSNAEIAVELGVSLNTVKTHLNNIYSKLGVSRRTQAISKAKELRILA